MNTTRTQILGLLLVVILFGFGFAKRTDINKRVLKSFEPTTIRIGYSGTSLKAAPTIVALENKLFEKYHLKAEPFMFKNGTDIQQALVSNQIDIGVTGANMFFLPISKNLPIKILMPLASSRTTIMVRKDSDINSLSQLEGKTVGIEQAVGNDTLVVLRVLQEEKIDRNKINFVTIEKALRPIALLQKKQIDASVTNDSELQTYNPDLAKELPGWLASEFPKKAFLRNVAGVNTDYLKNNSAAVEKYVKAMIDAQKMIKENPQESANAVANYLSKTTDVKISAEKVLDSFRLTTFMVWDKPEVIQSIADTAYSVGDLKTKLSIDQILEQKFAPLQARAQQEIYGDSI